MTTVRRKPWLFRRIALRGSGMPGSRLSPRNKVACASVAALVWLVPSAPAHARTKVGEAVRRYAPLVRLHPDDNDRPISAGQFINNSQLWWSHADCPHHRVDDGHIDASRLAPRQPPGYGHRLAGDGGFDPCVGHHGRHYFAGELTRPHDENNILGCSTTSAPCAEGFYMDLIVRPPGGTDAPVYFEFRKHPRSITYWFIYGFNEGDPGGFTNHEGDWERISVQLDDNNHARKVAYYQHDGSCVLDWNAAPKTRAGHPIVYSDTGSHASSPTGTDGGPRWGTWKHLRNVLQTPWYGYGGAWGSASDTSITTGPLGPSPYKLGPSQGFDQAGC
jgi:hypothetical protein